MRSTYAEIWALFDRSQRRRLVLLILMMILMGLFDLLGVASVLPFLAVLANPDVLSERAGLAAAYEAMGFTTIDAFLRFLGLIVFIFVVGSIGFRALTFYFVTRFTRSVGYSLARQLVERYLAQPYEWFLQQHSADLAKSVLNEVNQVVTGSIAPAMRVLANSVVVFLLIVFLVYLEPVGAVATAVLVGSAFGVLYAMLRGYLLRTGRARAAATRERFTAMQEAMSGIKEVKLLGLEHQFLTRFLAPSKELVRYQANLSLIGDMPRYGLEAIAFGGMMLFVLWLLYSGGGDLSAVLPIIGVFAFAGLKLMPTAQILFKDVSTIRYGYAALERLRSDLAELPPALPSDDGTTLSLDRSLVLDGVDYRYEGADRDALSRIDLTVPARSSLGIVGTTGAGKTTMIDVLLGLLRPTAGTLSLDGVEITEANRRAWQRSVGYVSQDVRLIDDTIAANIAFGLLPHEIDHERVRTAARLARVDSFAEALPQRYDTSVGDAGVRLSGGQRQRIVIARALYRDPAVLVFDEATSALDRATEREVMEAIGALSGLKTMIIITHRLSTVRDCDQIVLMRGGRIVSKGTYEELLETEDDFKLLA